MATSHTATSSGQQEAAGDRKASFLKVFSGEVLTAFERMNIGLNLVKTRTLTSGKSAQFPVIGQAADTDVAAHTPGADVSTNVIKFNEKVITIDSRYYYSQFVDDYEDKMSHFEYRGELANQAAEAISTKIDKAIFQGVNDSVAVSPVADQKAGTTVTNTAIHGGATAEARGDAMVDAIFDANAAFNANDIPMEGRVCVTRPENYYEIVRSQKAVNRDYTNGNGGIDSGTVLNIAGTPILWSNHLPAFVLTTNQLEALFFTPDCYGVVKFMDITSEANYLPEKLGTLMTSYYALGMGTLNPGAACKIMSA